MTETAKTLFQAIGDAAQTEGERIEMTFAKVDAAVKKTAEQKPDTTALQTLLDKYKSYTRQREEIEKKYNDDVAALEKARTEENSAQIDAALAKAVKEKKNQLSKVDLSEMKEDTNWEVIFGNLNKVSHKALLALRDKLKEYMTTAKESLNAEEVVKLEKAYDDLNKKIGESRPGKAWGTALDTWRKAKAELKKARAESGAKKGSDESSEAEAKTQEKINEALSKRRAAMLALNESTQSYAAKSKDALGAATSLTGMLEGFGVKIPASIKGALEGAGTVVEGLGSIDFTKPFSIVTGAFKMIGGLGKMFTSLFSGDNRKEDRIQKLQKQVNALTKSYKKLDEALSKSYSSDSANLIREQEQNLLNQKALIEEQIGLENDKKNTDKGKIQKWKETLEGIDKELAQTQNRIIEAMIGTDVKSAIGDFSSAFVNALAAGEDKAASMKGVVRNMVKSAVVELVKSRLSPEVGQFMAFLAEAMQDGILSGAEQSALDEWEQRLYDKANGISDTFGKYFQGDKGAEERTGASRGIATASQESVDENNGRLTAIQGHTYTINESVKTLVANSGQVLDHLAGIRLNTGANVAEMREMRKDISSMKSTMNDIALKGITIKK